MMVIWMMMTNDWGVMATEDNDDGERERRMERAGRNERKNEWEEPNFMGGTSFDMVKGGGSCIHRLILAGKQCSTLLALPPATCPLSPSNYRRRARACNLFNLIMIIFFGFFFQDHLLCGGGSPSSIQGSGKISHRPLHAGYLHPPSSRGGYS
jgi:hypothetical protein